MTHGLSSFWDELVATGGDLDRLLELTARRAAEVVGEASVLTTVSDDGTLLEPRAVHHPDPDVREFVREVVASAPYRVGEGMAGLVAARREPAVISEVDTDALAEAATPHTLQFLARYPIRSLAIVPMTAFGELVGTLGAVRITAEEPYGEEDVVALEALAERAGLALAEARNRPRAVGPSEYEAIFRQSVDGVLFTAPDGRILAANPAACQILRLPETEICRRGRPGVLVDSPETRAALVERARTGRARAELAMRRGDGETFTADISSTIFTTPDGEQRASVIFRDVSDRVRARQDLETKHRHLSLLHQVTTAVNEAPDLATAIHRTLEAVGTATDWPLGDAFLLADDAVLRPSSAWCAPDAPRLSAFLEWIRGAAVPLDQGLVGRVLRSRSPLWVADLLTEADYVRGQPPGLTLRSYVGVPVMVGTRARGVLELFSDERMPRDEGLLSVLVGLGTQLGRALERSEAETGQQRLDEERAEFVARAAHELRSPVAALVMAVGVLAEHGIPDRKDQELLDVIVDSTEHLNRLVTRLLDLSTLERGALQLSIEPVDLGPLVQRVVAACPAPPDHTVTWNVGAGVRAEADELSIEQILTNLLVNAYRYGGDEIQLDVRGDGDRVHASVTDNGPGVDPAIESSLFDPFVRGPGRRADGTGLGLAISHRLAVAMGGSLRYERGEGSCSRFVLELPAST